MVLQVKHRMGYDDALDAFHVHGVGGMCGGVLTGFFANDFVTGSEVKKGVFYGRGVQVRGVVFPGRGGGVRARHGERRNWRQSRCGCLLQAPACQTCSSSARRPGSRGGRPFSAGHLCRPRPPPLSKIPSHLHFSFSSPPP